MAESVYFKSLETVKSVSLTAVVSKISVLLSELSVPEIVPAWVVWQNTTEERSAADRLVRRFLKDT
jgi:hypothetical protein